MFNAHDLRVYDLKNVVMECNCSRDKVHDLIKILGFDDAQKLVSEKGSISVTCEMCGKEESFDKIDVLAIFSDNKLAESNKNTH